METTLSYNRTALFLFTGMILFIVGGCATPNQFIYYEREHLTSVEVGTPGVRITAEDGSFIFESGKTYSVPPDYPSHYWYWTTGGVATSNFSKLDVTDGKKVWVKVPGHEKPLYGFLEFGKIISECRGKEPATRSYYIQVPPNYVQDAMGGRVSVMYEYYKCTQGYYTNGQKVTPRTRTTWTLWLSDRPLF